MKERMRSAKQTIRYLVLPLVGAGFIGYLLSLLDKDALWMGLTWLILGIVYHLLMGKRSARMQGSGVAGVAGVAPVVSVRSAGSTQRVGTLK